MVGESSQDDWQTSISRRPPLADNTDGPITRRSYVLAVARALVAGLDEAPTDVPPRPAATTLRLRNSCGRILHSTLLNRQEERWSVSRTTAERSRAVHRIETNNVPIGGGD